MIQLIAGLGNPGAQYERTRHNAGFWFVNELAAKLGVQLREEKGFHGEVARVSVSGKTLWLVKPLTFMNLSGKSVAALARFYKIPPEAVLVAHDELDLPPGHVKLKQGGSHAGHNGLKSLHSELGSAEYWRLRLGIGHPGTREAVIGYVLGRASTEHQAVIEEAVTRSCAVVEPLLQGEMARAMMQLHTKPKPPSPSVP